MSDIRKRKGKNGTSYQVRYPTKDGYAFKSFRTRREALAFREDALARAKQVRSRGAHIKTVADGLQLWLDVCEKEGRDGRPPVTKATLIGYQWRRDLILEYQWPELHDLKPADVRHFRGWALRRFSRDLSQKLLSSFHSMVIELVQRDILSFDIAAGISVQGGSRYDEPVKIPTEKEVFDLLAAADRLANSKNLQVQKTWERYRPMLYLAADSGMRPQEYLVVPENNLTNKGVAVSQALEARGLRISVTKTPSGRRFIDLSTETVSMIRAYVRKREIEESINKHGLIFPTSSGHWQLPGNWQRRGFAVACKEAGLSTLVIDDKGEERWMPRYSPYSLRHFYASMLIDRRVNLKRVQQLMGHSRIETTLHFYGHLVERKEAESEVRIGLVSDIRGSSCGNHVAKASQVTVDNVV